MRFYQNQIKIIILLCNGIAKGQQNKVYIRVYVEIHLASLISSAISPNFWFQMIFSCVAIEQARSSYLFMNVQMFMGSRLCGYHLFSFCWYWHIFDMCLSFTVSSLIVLCHFGFQIETHARMGNHLFICCRCYTHGNTTANSAATTAASRAMQELHKRAKVHAIHINDVENVDENSLNNCFYMPLCLWRNFIRFLSLSAPCCVRIQQLAFFHWIWTPRVH